MAQKQAEAEEKRVATLKDAQLLLDSMLPPLKTYQRNIKANGTLTVPERIYLLMIVIDFERMSGTYNYQLALSNINDILDKRYRPSEDSKREKKNGEVIYVNPPSKPFLIVQVIFFIAVSCKVYGIIKCTQAAICEHLGISHNFFTNLDRKPEEYINLLKHEQPERVITYNGQKDKELGVAIKYLAYQAGEYDYYVDLFGGTGAASTAVCRRNDATYVYNEKDEIVYNLFKVIKDNKLYKDLIDEIKKLKDALYFGKQYLDDVDFEKEINVFYTRNGKRKENETRIKNYNPHRYVFNSAEEKDWLFGLKVHLERKNENFTLTCLGNTYTKQNLLDMFDVPDLSASMQSNWEIVLRYSDLYSFNGYDYEQWFREELQYNFYKYYAYFTNLIHNLYDPIEDNKVKYAVACVFIQSLLTNNKEGISSILRMDVQYRDDVKGDEAIDWIKFLGRDYCEQYEKCGIKFKNLEELITDMHDAIKGTICENEDCCSAIYKYCNMDAEIDCFKAYIKSCIYSVLYDEKEDKVKGINKDITLKQEDIKRLVLYGLENTERKDAGHTLFYSDSPYTATTGYKQRFTELDIANLIDALMQSGDRFIFSCRAVKGKRSSDKTKKLIEDNLAIAEYTFGSFLDYWEKKQNLYVLAIEEGKSLKDAIKDDDDIEIMITNYEIKSFIDIDYKKVSYTVYEFAYLLKAILQYGRTGLTQQQIDALFIKHNLTKI